jgi:hypothetical protein
MVFLKQKKKTIGQHLSGKQKQKKKTSDNTYQANKNKRTNHRTTRITVEI